MIKKTYLLLLLLLMSSESMAIPQHMIYMHEHNLQNGTIAENGAFIESQIIISNNLGVVARNKGGGRLTLRAPDGDGDFTSGFSSGSFPGATSVNLGGSSVESYGYDTVTGADVKNAFESAFNNSYGSDSSYYSQGGKYVLNDFVEDMKSGNYAVYNKLNGAAGPSGNPSSSGPSGMDVDAEWSKVLNKEGNIRSLVNDPTGVVSIPIDHPNRYTTSWERKSKGNIVVKSLESNGKFTGGSRTYRAIDGKSPDLRAVWRAEQGIQILQNSLIEEDLDPSDPRMAKALPRALVKAVRTSKIIYAYEGKLPNNKTYTDSPKAKAFAAFNGGNPVIYLPLAQQVRGMTNYVFTGLDGKEVRMSAIREAVHETIHATLQKIKIQRLPAGSKVPIDLELQAVILTNKAMKGLEPQKGFYGSGHHSINSISTSGLEGTKSFDQVQEGVVDKGFVYKPLK